MGALGEVLTGDPVPNPTHRVWGGGVRNGHGRTFMRGPAANAGSFATRHKRNCATLPAADGVGAATARRLGDRITDPRMTACMVGVV